MPPGGGIHAIKISRRLAKNFVRQAKLPVLALQRLEPFTLVGRQPGPFALVMLSPPNPKSQRLRRAADLGRDRRNRRPLRCVLALMLLHHPNRPSPDLRRKALACRLPCFHRSILSRVGASSKPGAVQFSSSIRISRVGTAAPQRHSTRLRSVGAAPGRRRDEDRGVARGDEASRERLRLIRRWSSCRRAKCWRRDPRRHAEPGERLGVARVEHRANVGLVGDERGWLERADLVGFAERCHRRQRCVERRRSLRIEAASVHLAPRPDSGSRA